MTMREAIEKTLALHQMVVDGEYTDYFQAKKCENSGGCYLCDFLEYKEIKMEEKGEELADDCSLCPWVLFEKKDCDRSKYMNSPASIIRLNRWLSLLDAEEIK